MLRRVTAHDGMITGARSKNTTRRKDGGEECGGECGGGMYNSSGGVAGLRSRYFDVHSSSETDSGSALLGGEDRTTIPVEERAPAMLTCVQAVELAVAVGVVTLDSVTVQRARQRTAVEDNPCKRLPTVVTSVRLMVCIKMTKKKQKR